MYALGPNGFPYKNYFGTPVYAVLATSYQTKRQEIHRPGPQSRYIREPLFALRRLSYISLRALALVMSPA